MEQRILADQLGAFTSTFIFIGQTEEIGFFQAYPDYPYVPDYPDGTEALVTTHYNGLSDPDNVSNSTEYVPSYLVIVSTTIGLPSLPLESHVITNGIGTAAFPSVGVILPDNLTLTNLQYPIIGKVQVYSLSRDGVKLWLKSLIFLF